MKKSIRKEIATIFIALVSSILLVSVLVNSQFLESYYIRNKKMTLIEVYSEINNAVLSDSLLSDRTRENLGALIESGNISFVILDQANEHTLTATPNDNKTNEMIAQLMGYLFHRNPSSDQILAMTDSYEIHSTQDSVNGGEYIEMWGFLDDGKPFLLRSPLESIRESVELANEFLIYIVAGMLVIGSIFVWYFSKRITNPIMELTDLSKKMADLDFDAKYTSGGENEIGVLGDNFNRMSEKLEQTVSELKTANYELRKDIERKEKIDTMRTEFIGNVSHELKTPIALIQGYAEGLRDGVSDDPESKAFYCDVILDEANKMNQLVKNLLTLNQLEVGNEEVSFERFNLMELIQGVLMSSEILIQQKNAEIRVQDSEPIYVWADEWKVEQVFRNYLSNALNHLSGENVIDIRVIKKEQTVRVSVFNTGKPIPKEDIDQIWNKFYKVDKAHTRAYGGHGIGLSIVKAIMESFQKEYGVDNYDNGVAFWFELDLK